MFSLPQPTVESRSQLNSFYSSSSSPSRTSFLGPSLSTISNRASSTSSKSKFSLAAEQLVQPSVRLSPAGQPLHLLYVIVHLHRDISTSSTTCLAFSTSLASLLLPLPSSPPPAPSPPPDHHQFSEYLQYKAFLLLLLFLLFLFVLFLVLFLQR